MPENIKIISDVSACGRVELKKGEKAEVRINLTLTEPLEETDVLKIFLSASSYPTLAPIYCGIAETYGTDCCFSRALDTIDPEGKADTVKIIRKNAFDESVFPFLEVCFCEKESVKKPQAQSDDAFDGHDTDSFSYNHFNVYAPLCEGIKSPVERAADVLEKFRKSKRGNTEKSEPEFYMKLICERAGEFETVNACSLAGFKWHKITQPDTSFHLSAFEHILSHPAVLYCIRSFGHYLLGIKERENTICIAIPTAKDAPNPIGHVSDCTVYFRMPDADCEYCCVCVLLTQEGQYFTRIC